MKTNRSKLRDQLLFTLILILGGTLAFHGIDWDDGHHLHPDERFLTMVTTAISWPESWEEYLDESKSPLNPRNVGHEFFVYGTFPTTLVKGLSIVLGMTGYDQVYLVGRGMSAVAFLGSLFILFRLALLLFDDSRIALLAAFLYSVTVLPIQQAHFYTVDSLCTFFSLGALYWLVQVQKTGKTRFYFLTGLFFGLALASKLSVFTFAIIVTFVGIEKIYREFLNHREWGARTRVVAQVGGQLILSGIVTFLVFRVVHPDAFRGPGFWGMLPSERWLENIQRARLLVSGEIDTPPGHQWTNRTPIWFPLKYLVWWGMGPFLGVVAWLGWGTAIGEILRRKSTHIWIPVVWVGILFFNQGLQWVKSMRYMLPIYPILVLLAAWLLIKWFERGLKRVTEEGLQPERSGHHGWIAWIPIFVVGVTTFLWAIAFSRVYSHPHTRVAASEWMLENIPIGAKIGVEHWDDALPLPLEGHKRKPNDFVQFRFEWYADDTPKKLKQVLFLLDRSQYIVLSSNRLYDSIPRLPMRYPMTVNYYNALFDGTLGFERVAEFTSYPGILGWEIPDQSSEEAFSVYDHPRVQIFRKTEQFSMESAESILGDVDWSQVVKLTPRQATEGWTEVPPTEGDPPRESVEENREQGSINGFKHTQPRKMILPD